MKSLLHTLLAMALLASSGGAQAEVGHRVGDTAPEFSLADLNGERVSLEELRNDGHVLLVFWSTQCHVCHAMISEFKRVHVRYADRGLTFAAVNVGWEDAEAVRAYVREHDLNYLILNEDDKKPDIVKDYRLVGTPTFQLIAPDGTVLYRGHRLPNVERVLEPEHSG